MNKSILYILVLFAISLTACEKVIDVDLEEADTQYVVEAQLQEGEHPFEVVITTTSPYFESGLPQPVGSATVVLTDGQGNRTQINHVQNGRYTAMVNAVAGQTYTLEATINDVTYTAESFLPPKIELTEVYTEFQEATGFFDAGYLVYFRYQDPGEVSNYYRAIHYIDGVVQKEGDDMQVLDDVLNNGGEARFPVFGHTFNSGETVKLELIHFDEKSYDYFFSLSDILGDGGGPRGGSAAPGNPNTNWSGGLLGYFSAYSSDTLSVVVP